MEAGAEPPEPAREIGEELEPVEAEPPLRDRRYLRKMAAPPPRKKCPRNYPECTVEVHYGTNRAPERDAGVDRPNDYYGKEDGGKLELGTLTVSFPDDHSSGQIERPRFYRLEFREDPEKHVMIVALEPELEEAEWLGRLKAAGRNEAFVFVHGYNTRFDAAAWRAAQIAYDLDFAGVPMMYSWPSVGGGLAGLVAYERDEEMVARAVPHFRRFIKLATEAEGIDSVHVIAHSMGNRLVTAALDDLCRRDREPPEISQLVLAAPDVDTRAFQERFVETLPRLAHRVTIYASSKDKALLASKLKHEFEPRLGDAENDLLWQFQGIERIDASFVADTLDSGAGSKDFLQHSYFASNDSVASDLLCLLRGASPRPLLVEKAGVPGAWELRPRPVDRGDCGEPLPPEPGRATCRELYDRRTVPVPDLVGMLLDRARETLAAAELTAGSPEPERSRSPEGTVVRQRPQAGEPTAPGTEVALWVAEPGGIFSWWWLLLLLLLAAVAALAIWRQWRRQ